MSRLLFEKTGNAVWISHLDLMRVMQRSFRRAGLFLKHTGGFNQHAYVALALPLSVGTSSSCEVLDFDLTETVPPEEALSRLNAAFPDGIRGSAYYESGDKFGKLALLHARVTLEYDNGTGEALLHDLRVLFDRTELIIEKNGKKGPQQVDLKPMIHSLNAKILGEHEIELDAVVTAQNPSMNPMLLVTAIETHLPEWKPSFACCHRVEVLKEDGKVFR